MSRMNIDEWLPIQKNKQNQKIFQSKNTCLLETQTAKDKQYKTAQTSSSQEKNNQNEQ